MKTVLLPWFIQVIIVTFAYELKCPAPGHWRLRARKFYCGQSYVCLLQSPENSYRETCDGLDYSSTGSRLIFEPYFNKAGCRYSRYQPFPFSTDGNNKCVYQKSFCNEEGQIVHREGSMINDTTCGCDSSEGYKFVTTPKHNCYCLPSEEDCSCHKFICDDEGRTHRLNCVYFTVALLIVLTIVLPIYGLSQWPDAFYKVPSFKWIVDHLTFINMLHDEERNKIKKQTDHKEKSRIIMEKLLHGNEIHYDKFLEALNAFDDYKDLAIRIKNTEVTTKDKEFFQNCTERSN